MVLIKEHISRVLNRYYLQEVIDYSSVEKMANVEYEINRLDSFNVNIFAITNDALPLSWRRENYLIFPIDNFVFAYTKTNNGKENLVIIEEVAIRKGNNYEILTETTVNSYSTKPQQFYVCIGSWLTD